MLNNFFLINFPQGSAGKFLGSLLMASPSVAHYDQNIEKNKNNKLCLEYIENHFQRNFKKWIANEPNHVNAWNLHFLSSKYPRGDNLSTKEFIEQCNTHGTDHFKQTIAENKLILLPWHKTTFPGFFEKSKKITILIDTDSFEWFDRALWNKHYAIEDDKVVLLIHDWRLNQSMKKYFQLYNNPYYSNDPIDVFYDKHIKNNPDKQLFSNTFNERLNNLHVNLSDILCLNSLLEKIKLLENTFDLLPIDQDFIEQSHNHWYNLHA